MLVSGARARSVQRLITIAFTFNFKWNTIRARQRWCTGLRSHQINSKERMNGKRRRIEGKKIIRLIRPSMLVPRTNVERTGHNGKSVYKIKLMEYRSATTHFVICNMHGWWWCTSVPNLVFIILRDFASVSGPHSVSLVNFEFESILKYPECCLSLSHYSIYFNTNKMYFLSLIALGTRFAHSFIVSLFLSLRFALKVYAISVSVDQSHESARHSQQNKYR